jgi:CDP-paratose synthetase
LETTALLTQNKNVFISGVTGFMGRALSAYLLRQGYSVHGLVRPNVNKTLLADGLVAHSFSGAYEELDAALNIAKPVAVIHLATCFLSDHKPEQVPTLIEANITLGTQLLEACVANKVEGFINVGTAWQHYKNEPYLPVNLYAATKQAFEAILAYYVDAYPLNDTRAKLLPFFLKAAAAGTAMSLVPPEQKLHFVHSDDICRAFEVALTLLPHQPAQTAAVYTLPLPEALTLETILETFNALLEKPIQLNWGERSYRSREVLEPYSNGVSLPGWKAELPLREGAIGVMQAAGLALNLNKVASPLNKV